MTQEIDIRKIPSVSSPTRHKVLANLKKKPPKNLDKIAQRNPR